MDVVQAIQQRRSVKAFTEAPVPREVVEQLVQLAILAPNHGLTEPWRFFVMGEETKRRYGAVRARYKTAKIEDAARAEEKRRRIAGETAAIPAVLAVAAFLADDPVVREEDYAAVFMAIENVLVAAPAFGLGGKVHTGRILEDDELRAVLNVPRRYRIVALLHLGEPLETPGLKRRRPVAEVAHWLP